MFCGYLQFGQLVFTMATNDNISNGPPSPDTATNGPPPADNQATSSSVPKGNTNRRRSSDNRDSTTLMLEPFLHSSSSDFARKYLLASLLKKSTDMYCLTLKMEAI